MENTNLLRKGVTLKDLECQGCKGKGCIACDARKMEKEKSMNKEQRKFYDMGFKNGRGWDKPDLKEFNLVKERLKLKKSFIEISKYPREILDHIFEALYYQDKELTKQLKDEMKSFFLGDNNMIVSKNILIEINKRIDKLVGVW